MNVNLLFDFVGNILLSKIKILSIFLKNELQKWTIYYKISIIIINIPTNIIVFNAISDNYYFKLSLILNKI